MGEAYFNIGVNYMILTNDSLALYYYTKAYEINPKDEKAKYEIREAIMKC